MCDHTFFAALRITTPSILILSAAKNLSSHYHYRILYKE